MSANILVERQKHISAELVPKTNVFSKQFYLYTEIFYVITQSSPATLHYMESSLEANPQKKSCTQFVDP